jgi:hypothetical protein
MSTLALVVIASADEAFQNHSKTLDCFVARAPVRKRFAFVAGNDGYHE